VFKKFLLTEIDFLQNYYLMNTLCTSVYTSKHLFWR